MEWMLFQWMSNEGQIKKDQVCQWLAEGRWFSSDIPVSSSNKTDHHDIAEILLKVTLSSITQPF